MADENTAMNRRGGAEGAGIDDGSAAINRGRGAGERGLLMGTRQLTAATREGMERELRMGAWQ